MNPGRSLLYFLAVVAPRLCMFAVIFALARLLPVAEVGLFVLVVTVGELLEMVAANWVRVYIQNREAGNERISALRVGRMLAITLLVTALAVLCAIPAAHIVAEAAWAPFALAAVAYILAFGTLRYALGVLQALGRHADVARVELARALGIGVAILGVVIAGPKSFLMPSLALSAATMVVALWGVMRTWRYVARPQFTTRGLVAAATFGLPMVGDTLLAYMLVSFDRLVLNETIGPAAVGVYGVAYALGRQPIDFVAGPLNNLTVPALFAARAQAGERRAQAMQSGVMLTLFIVCVAMLAGVYGLREPIVRLVLKPEFWADTIWLMPAITAAACLMVFKAYLFDNIYYLYGRTALKLKIAVPVGLSCLALTYLLIRQFGLSGAAWALVIGAGATLAASALGSRRFFRFEVPVAAMLKVLLVAGLAAAALWLAAMAARPLGPLVEIAAGFVAFTLVYAAGLSLIGVSVRAMVATPWAPLAARPVSRP